MPPKSTSLHGRWRLFATAGFTLSILACSAQTAQSATIPKPHHHEEPPKLMVNTGRALVGAVITENGDVYATEPPGYVFYQNGTSTSPNQILAAGDTLGDATISDFNTTANPLEPLYGSGSNILVCVVTTGGQERLVVINNTGTELAHVSSDDPNLPNSGMVDPRFGAYFGCQQVGPGNQFNNDSLIVGMLYDNDVSNPAPDSTIFYYDPAGNLPGNQMFYVPPILNSNMPDKFTLQFQSGSFTSNPLYETANLPPGVQPPEDLRVHLCGPFRNTGANPPPNGTFTEFTVEMNSTNLGTTGGPGAAAGPEIVVFNPIDSDTPLTISQVFELLPLGPLNNIIAGVVDGSPSKQAIVVASNSVPDRKKNKKQVPCSRADLNGDGKVDQADRKIFDGCMAAARLEKRRAVPSAACAKADLNRDGKINDKDRKAMTKCLRDALLQGTPKDLDPDFENINMGELILREGDPVPGFPDWTVSYIEGIRSNGLGVAVIGVGAADTANGNAFKQAVLLLDDDGLTPLMGTGTDFGEGPMTFLDQGFGLNDRGLSNVNANGQFVISVLNHNFNTLMYRFQGRNSYPDPDSLTVLTEHTDIWGSENHGSSFDPPVQLDFTGFHHDPASGWMTLPGHFDIGPSTDFVTITPLGQAWLATSDEAGGLNAPVFCSSGWVVNEAAGFTVLSGDFDGDGLCDLAQIHPTGTVFIGLNNGTTVDAPSTTWQNGTFIDTSSGLIPIAGDFDGNGVDDIGQLNNNTGDFWVSLGGSPFTNGYTDWTATDGVFRHDPANAMGVHVGDFNGDGIDDLCQVTNANIQVALSDGTAFGTPSIWAINGFADDPNREANGWWTFTGDVDGDYDDDIVQLNSDGEIFYELSNGVDFFVGPPVNAAALGFRHKPQGPWQMFFSQLD